MRFYVAGGRENKLKQTTVNNLPNIRHFASNPNVPSVIPIVHIHPSITLTVVPNLAFPLTPTNTKAKIQNILKFRIS